MLGKLPRDYDDWLICMISSQLGQFIPDFDEIISVDSQDFDESGLKTNSVIRIGRLAVVNGEILLGSIGQIGSDRLQHIKSRLGQWIMG